MKKTLLALSALLAAMSAMSGDLTVIGKGTAKRQPDKMKITFTVSATDKDITVARKLFDERTASLTATFLAAGIATNEIMTTGMDMSKEYDYRGGGEKVFDGYRFREDYTFAAKLNRKRLEQIKAALFDSEAIESLRLWYELFDPSALRVEARAAAVANAKEIAEALAAAAGVSLREIEEIEYSSARDNNYSRMNCLAAADFGEESVSATSLQDISVSDSVCIKWKIK